jgi:alpha-beta hydrolase superfamily lysophospholipase
MSARRGIEMLQSGERVLAHAAEFPLPLLLVHGTADRITSAQASQEFAAKVHGDCTLKLWEGFYHETHNEPEKAQVMAVMIDWLQNSTLQ